MTVMRDFHGITVEGGFYLDDEAIHLTVSDRRRIAAVREAAARHLRPTDDVLQALERAVTDGFPDVDLPAAYDEHDALVLATILDDVTDGDDGAPARAARFIRDAAAKGRTRECPYCDGTGELHG